MINIRCFRYYLDLSTPSGLATKELGYRQVLESLPVVYNTAGDIKFCGGYVFETKDIDDFVNHDIWTTPAGTFLVDGVVGYTEDGVCIQALKYHSAGRGETTEVLGIKWNDQGPNGKDSWSANALIQPIQIRGAVIKKPTVGSIKKMIQSGISKGAKVTVILANSTIPQVSQVVEPGNGDYEWPTCGCGYKLGPSDIYGTLVKCGNPECTEREGRMRKYLSGCSDFFQINLNKLLVIDRFDWLKKTDYPVVLQDLYTILVGKGYTEFLEFLKGCLKTPLQIKNLELVSKPAYKTLKEYVDGGNNP